MLKRLLELKEVVKQCANMGNNAMKLVEAQWKMVDELAAILQKAYKVTLKV